ncbi:acyltransferase family protein [Adhaeribacter aquaticus]|uniref:acyltransferase family protein n=1 Tax=Adhaeribacter aquaticus TaxID=299567 RepID=UPI000479FDD7|nr:acyltransferase family protein [Adhaeribacter aquaticus]
MNNKSFNLTISSWAVFAFLRFLLAFIVMASHMPTFGPIPAILQNFEMLGGKAAVFGFLLISGLSIGHSYSISKSGYFQRRFIRIYPLYFIAVLFTIGLQYYLKSPYTLPGLDLVAAGLITNFANFFFLQGFLVIPITYNGPLWSLSIEIFFYLLIPLFAKLPAKALACIILLSMAFYFVTPTYVAVGLMGYSALIYAWPWLTGYLLSRQQVKSAIALIMLGAFVVYSNKVLAVEALGWITYIVVASLVFISCFVSIKLNKAVLSIFNFLGEISYPLYLFHFPLLLLFFHLGVSNPWQLVLFVFIAVIPINYIFDKWLKHQFWRPLVRLLGEMVRTHIFPAKKRIINLPVTK